jgi:RNA polymerase sigma factor (sigma-70 family)
MSEPLALSVKALDVLQDNAATEPQRHAAFERMLELPVGWWGDQPLVLFAGGIHSSPRAWLKGVIRNMVLNEIRQGFRDRDAAAIAYERFSIGHEDSSSQPSRGHEDAADERVLRAIQSLPRSLGVVARLLFIERLSRQEIAETLGLTPETLRQRIHRLRESLAEELRRRS